MTTLELADSRTPSEINAIVSELQATVNLQKMVDYTFNHPSRLIKPAISYDASAMALSFVPAAGEGQDETRRVDNDAYTYHHLRRDLFEWVADSGVHVISRYIVPSAHITIGRFITQGGFLLEQPGSDGSRVDRERIKALAGKIEQINQRLKQYWPGQNGNASSKGEWIVGQEKGLELCKGTSWYGKGECVILGKGFN